MIAGRIRYLLNYQDIEIETAKVSLVVILWLSVDLSSHVVGIPWISFLVFGDFSLHVHPFFEK